MHNKFQPGIQRVQALADTLRSARYVFAMYKAISLQTCVLSYQQNPCTTIANPSNTAQLEGTPYHSPKLHLGPWSSVGMRRGTDRHTDCHGQYTFRLGYASRKM